VDLGLNDLADPVLSYTACCEVVDLPVELGSFSAIVDNSSVLLSWTTLSETNNAGFEIQRSRNNQNWTAVDFVDGNWTTTETTDYSYEVKYLEPGKHAFRLKQLDLDGSHEYSDVLEVSTEIAGTHLLYEPYPNPFNPQANIEFVIGDEVSVEMSLFDMNGKMIKTLYNGTPEPGNVVRVSIDGTNIPSGLYLVRLSGPNFSDSKRIILQK